MKKLLIIGCFALLISCTMESNNQLEGKWKMFKVIQNSEDVSPEHNPFNERFIIFNSDSTFESGGRPFGKNTGRYILNSDENTLFLDSDVGPDDDSQWRITFSADTMKWQGFGSEWAENFRLVHVRTQE